MLSFEEKKKYLKWYRLAQETINDKGLIPDIDDEKVLNNLVSGENWLCLVSTEIDKENAKNSENPNVYIQIERKELIIGLVFNTASSIDKINNILLDQSKEQRGKIINLLQQLDDRYYTTLETKTKKKNYAESPTYSNPILTINSNKIDDKFIEKLFTESERLRKMGKEKREKGLVQFEGPHIGLVRIEIPMDEEDFKNVIKEIIEIWKVCITIRDDSEIRGSTRKQIKELESQKENIEDLISHGLHVEELTVKLKEVDEKIKKLKMY
jgi:hypothetical protein